MLGVRLTGALLVTAALLFAVPAGGANRKTVHFSLYVTSLPGNTVSAGTFTVLP
jgi:hypothetical protein